MNVPALNTAWQSTAQAPSLSVKQQPHFRPELPFLPASQICFSDLKQNSLFSRPRFHSPGSCRAAWW